MLIRDNDLGYCPKSISGCARPGDMCPAKDTHGTTLTDTIPQDDGTVTCAFGSGACLYDSNGKLVDDKNGGACPSTVTETTTGKSHSNIDHKNHE
ncbi:unnamed protein product [Rotaria sp. Silwood2]|nr:unnamed protein product [Rotaria sp. Silwood2]